MHAANPFHEGELKAQQLSGEAEMGASNGAMIGHTIMSGALNFIRAQEMVVVSSRDNAGRRWASLLFGKKGFLQPNGASELRIALDPSRTDGGDPLWKNLESDSRAGLLVIDLETRRRLRINGKLQRNGLALEMSVEESYPNCPKYITRREMKIVAREQSTADSERLSGAELQTRQKELIESTDLLFMATGHLKRGADASHRGGKPGFVEVLDERRLRIPDYPGNSMFNSLGNLLVDAHVGLLIPDFVANRQLQITGKAKVEWSAKDVAGVTGGTKRFVEVEIDDWLERPLAVKVESKILDYSKYNP